MTYELILSIILLLSLGIRAAEDEDIIEKLKANNLTDIEPDDHMDAVPYEADGSLNKDFNKEIFLGEHEELENLNPEKLKFKYRSIFKKLVFVYLRLNNITE